jgi:hypothetical protein
LTILVPDTGEALLLKYMLNHTVPESPRMHLYDTKATDPNESDILGTYTAVELADAGYTASTMTGTLWTVATVTGTTSGTYPRVHFSISTTASVQGLFVTNSSDTELLWAERFDAGPFNIPSGGGVIAVDPAIEVA